MIDVNRQGEVWVFAEQHGGELEDTPLELMTKARRLADTLGVKLGAALLGHKIKALAKKLVQHGADKVYLAEHPLLKQYQTNSYAKVMYDLIHKHEPQIVLYGATITGRDLAPRIASATKAGLTADPDLLLAADPELIVRAVGELSPRTMRAEAIGWMPLRPVSLIMPAVPTISFPLRVPRSPGAALLPGSRFAPPPCAARPRRTYSR